MKGFKGVEGEDINGIRGIRNEFGAENEAVLAYERMLRATRAYLMVSEVYYLSPVGSINERRAQESIDKMNEDMLDHADKAVSLVGSLGALIMHMKHGGTYDQWFEGLDDNHD